MFAPKPYWTLERFSSYAAALVRYYSRRSDFTTRLTSTIDTACVIPSRKQVLINPEWDPAPREYLSRVQVSGHERLTLTLEATAAHEAAHIRFSGDWPGGLLGQLVNSLEDERIERLQAADFPLQRAFVFLGDYTLLSGEQNEAFFTARAGILLWRFQHDFPHEVWSTDEPEWDSVKPLVERAWVAADTDEVVALAREIMAILGLDESAPEDAELSDLGMRGDGEAAPAEDVGETQTPGSGSGGVPPKPDDDLESFGNLDERLALARPLASQLERILKAPRRAGTALSRSRGRLSVRRVIRGEERPFEKKCEHVEKPRRIIVLHDISYSMGTFHPENAQYHAVLTSLALELACARLGVKFALISFDDVSQVERPFEMPKNEALVKVASLASRNNTALYPALKNMQALVEPSDLVFILCDGFLADGDVLHSRTLLRRRVGTLIPVLIGDDVEVAQFEQIFGRAYLAATASEIPALVKRVLLAKEAGAL